MLRKYEEQKVERGSGIEREINSRQISDAKPNCSPEADQYSPRL